MSNVARLFVFAGTGMLLSNEQEIFREKRLKVEKPRNLKNLLTRDG